MKSICLFTNKQPGDHAFLRNLAMRLGFEPGTSCIEVCGPIGIHLATSVCVCVCVCVCVYFIPNPEEYHPCIPVMFPQMAYLCRYYILFWASVSNFVTAVFSLSFPFHFRKMFIIQLFNNFKKNYLCHITSRGHILKQIIPLQLKNTSTFVTVWCIHVCIYNTWIGCWKLEQLLMSYL